jgi:hypothetical protein
MDLTPEQIVNNWNKFTVNIETYISSPRKEKLLAFYEKYSERIATMPASHKPQYHNCFAGGYVEHVNRVVDAALDLNQVWKKFGAAQNYTTEELVFSAINHDLGKFGTEEEESYIPQTDAWRKEKLGELYTFNDKLEFMSVPDRGLYLLQTNDIPVTKNELLAIKLHDGIYDEANKPYLISFNPENKPRTSLIHIIHQADFLASRVEFEREWFPKFGNKPQPAYVKKAKAGANVDMKSTVNKFFEAV